MNGILQAIKALFDNAFGLVLRGIEIAGIGMQHTPSLVVIAILIYLSEYIGRRIGSRRGIVRGINLQRTPVGGGVPAGMHADATAYMRNWRRYASGFRVGLIQFCLGFISVFYIGWVWAFDFSRVTPLVDHLTLADILTGMHNPFEIAHQIIIQIGVGFQNQPWLVLVTLMVIGAFRLGIRNATENGINHGIDLQTGGAVPPAGSGGANWRRNTLKRQVANFLMNWSVRILTVVYILWLWSTL